MIFFINLITKFLFQIFSIIKSFFNYKKNLFNKKKLIHI